MKSKWVKIVSIILLVVLAVSCAPKGEPVLKITGIAEKAWTADELKAFPAIEAEYTNKDGEKTSYSGVALQALVDAAGVKGYVSLTLIAADDYSSEVTKDELSACPTCIVTIKDDGSLLTVMPGFSGKQQVKDLVEIKAN